MRHLVIWALPIVVLAASGPAAGSDFPFTRGDWNDDGSLNLTDAIDLLAHLFPGGDPPSCSDAGDANDDGILDVSDAVIVILHLFGGLSQLPPPFGQCGTDPTEDGLDCAANGQCPKPPGLLLSDWLDARPAVRNAMVWWEEGKGWIDHDDWSAALREELLDAFEAAWSGGGLPIENVPPNLLTPGDLGSTRTVLSRADAHSLYFSLIVRSLLVEIGDLVPWSLDEYDATALEALFDGRKIFERNIVCLPAFSYLPPEQPIPTSCSGIGIEVDSYWGMPAPGGYAWDFLETDVGIGPSRRETIGNMIDWGRRNMLHFGGSFRADVAEYYWGYRGSVPAARVLEGTDPVGFHPQSEEWGYAPGTGYDALFAHWTAGCHGTVTFFREVLRAANVPVRYELIGGHATPHFLGDDLYLSHGDDPYNVLSKADYAAGLLLIDAPTFQAWFGGDATQAKANVGRQVKVLAAIYLPTTLLRYRCDDIAQGLPPESGSTFRALTPAYTLEELEQMGFWASIDAEIARRGGCGAIH